MVPCRRNAAPPDRPLALAPVWARLVIGAVSGAALGRLAEGAAPWGVGETVAGIAALSFALGFGASVAADLDRPRPRWELATLSGLVYGGPALLLGALAVGGSFFALLALPLLPLPVVWAAGGLRALCEGDPRPGVRGLECIGTTFALWWVPRALIDALGPGWLLGSLALAGPPVPCALAGLAVTGGLIAATAGARASASLALRL